MSDPKEYEHDKSCVEITTLVMRKVVDSVTDEGDVDSLLVINFADGMKLKIRYDYIYEWEVVTQ